MRYWIISFLFLCFCLGTYAQKKPVSVIITAGQSNTDGRVSNNDLPDYIKKNGYRHCLWSYASDLTIQRDLLHFDAQGAELLGKRVYECLVQAAGKIR